MISDLVAAISADVTAALLAAGWPVVDGSSPLYGQGILIGRDALRFNSSPPRIVFIPASIEWDAKDPAFPTNVPTVALQRPLRTEWQTFEVHVWAVAPTPDPSGGDFDFTFALYQQVLRSCESIACGTWKASRGKWPSAAASTTQAGALGQEVVFSLALPIPLTDSPISYVTKLPIAPYLQAPSGTVVKIKVTPDASATDTVTITR